MLVLEERTADGSISGRIDVTPGTPRARRAPTAHMRARSIVSIALLLLLAAVVARCTLWEPADAASQPKLGRPQRTGHRRLLEKARARSTDARLGRSMTGGPEGADAGANGETVCGLLLGEGEPLVGGTVGVVQTTSERRARSQVDEEGRFCLRGVEPGDRIWAVSDGWLSAEVAIAHAEQIELRRAAHLRLRVRLPDEARRCLHERREGAYLSIMHGRFGSGMRMRSDSAPVDGWTERDLAPGHAQISVRFAGYSAAREVTLVAGQTLELELALALEDDTAVLDIRLLDPERLVGLPRHVRIWSLGQSERHTIYGDDIWLS